MAFTTALSGVNAAQSDLDVISNNIANSSTTGFKTARAEFGDVYAHNVIPRCVMFTLTQHTSFWARCFSFSS